MSFSGRFEEEATEGHLKREETKSERGEDGHDEIEFEINKKDLHVR